MSAFTLRVRYLRALREVTWNVPALAVVIGANASGKSTLLLVLKLLRAAYDRGLPEAVATVLGGSHNLKSWGADDDEPVELGVVLGDLEWRATLIPRGASVDYLNPETLVVNGLTVYEKDSLGKFIYGTEALGADQRLGVRALVDAGRKDPHVARLANFMKSITVFHDPDLWALRTQGSSTSDDRQLHSRGLNAITMLRKWHQERPHRVRYQFVLDGLKAAFPGAVADVDFGEAGQTLVMQIYKPGRETPSPLASEANGVLQLLVLLCDVAGGDRGGVVAIDEPENCLHPFAIRCFLRVASAYARRENITLILTTHSPALLDELGGDLESVFVMRTGDHVLPEPLVKVRDPAWLENFRLGNVYSDGEIGSNDDPES